MEIRSRKRFKKVLLILCVLALAGIIWVYHQYGSYLSAPEQRLGLADYYPEMPPDSKHIYMEFPVDHNNSELGKYKGFYILGPNFTPQKEVIFYLTDGQQNKVSTTPDYKAFEEKLPGLSYVIMGRRGLYPTLFPEVYSKDGSLDYKKAMNLYGTAQQIEDIELVRQDLERKGYLPPDGKIMLFGTSGAGILIQEYLAKHGEHVSRVLLEATGAPDIVINHKTENIGSPFAEIMKEENPQVLKKLENILDKEKVNNAALCFMLYKIQLFDIDWKNTCSKLINEIDSGNKRTYYKNLCNPEYSFALTKLMNRLPMMDAVNVRIFEIAGEQLMKYQEKPGEINVPFEWEKEMIEDYLQQAQMGNVEIPKISLVEERKKYNGEVLVLIGDLDCQFSVQAAEVISNTYPNAKCIVVHDTHAMLLNKKAYQSLRTSFFKTGLYAIDSEKK